MSIFFRKPWQFSWEMTRSWAESLCVMVSGCLGVNVWVRLGLNPDVIVKLVRELLLRPEVGGIDVFLCGSG